MCLIFYIFILQSSNWLAPLGGPLPACYHSSPGRLVSCSSPSSRISSDIGWLSIWLYSASSYRHSSCFCEYNLWSRHDMATISALLAICEDNPPATGGLSSARTSNMCLLCFLCCFEQAVEQTIGVSMWWSDMKTKDPRKSFFDAQNRRRGQLKSFLMEDRGLLILHCQRIHVSW